MGFLYPPFLLYIAYANLRWDTLMIKIQEVTKIFGSKIALGSTNFQLNDTGVVALIGENGAGKSTLMRIMCGYVSADNGKILIDDFDISSQRMQALKLIGYVPETTALYGEMIVYDFLVWIGKIWHLQSLNELILKISKQLKITDVLDENIENLSKGFKKRVQIAAALLHEPKFLILDEPTDGLDPNQRHEIRDFLKTYAENHAILVSTHSLEDLVVADRVIMLSHGKIIKDTSIEDFKKISHHKDLSEAFRILSSL